MSRRTWAAIILAAWALSLGWLLKRELFQSTGDRLAAAALNVAPGTDFYRLVLGGQQVGFASTTWDTAGPRLHVTDLLVLGVPAAGRVFRTRARSSAVVTRALRLETLDVDLDNGSPVTAHAAVTGDSSLSVTVSAGAISQSSRLHLGRPLVLPGLLALRLALTGALKAGRTLSVSVFDPFTLTVRDVRATIAAETTLVEADSAEFDRTAKAWVPARLDTVRAFEIDEATAGQTTRTWVDAQGRLVEARTAGGFEWTRSAYEIAVENLRAHPIASDPSRGDTVVRATALATGLTPAGTGTTEARARLTGIDLTRLELDGGRQQLSGDTLTVRPEDPSALAATYPLPQPPAALSPWLLPEPLIPSASPTIVAQALQILGPETDPTRAAERLLRWVATRIRPGAAPDLPVVLAVITGRRGDSNGFTALYVSLARAAGLPARPVAGLLAQAGHLYYHAWPEVYLGDWVPVDPMLDQFPADAGHLRFLIGGFARQLELVGVLGHVKLTVP